MWSISIIWCCVISFHPTWSLYSKPTVYQKIRQTSKLSGFYSLLEMNRPTKLNLQYGELTVFAPTNEALEWFSGGNLNNVINYHMAWNAKLLKNLKTGSLTTILEQNPPLWVTRLEDDIFINNARIIQDNSNYISEINNKPRKPQVLHVIDEVLNPYVKMATKFIYNPTAFDFISNCKYWDVENHRTELFYRKVIASRKEHLFKSEGSFTFFIPVDEAFTDYRLQIFDGNVIKAHVIPNRVLFTRPTPKETPFETAVNSDYLYVVVLFSGSEGKLFIKSHTLTGDSTHPTGEIIAEVVKSNIPVRNGVIHLIKRPLVVFDQRLTLFPYLPIINKLSMDPTLSFTYDLGEKSNFNTILNTENKKITYFIPRNKAWRNLQAFLGTNNTVFNDFISNYGKSILSRHVVVSNVSYTMADLVKKSNNVDTADINLPTLGGILKVGVSETDGSYVIYWRNQILPVVRENYMCTNGIVHIVDQLFVNEEDLPGGNSQDSTEENHLKLLNLLIQLTL